MAMIVRSAYREGMNAKPDKRLREELKEAIATVRHQIEVQALSDHYIGSGRITEDAIGQLQAELAQLEEALAELG
jgi:hypothetical protein